MVMKYTELEDMLLFREIVLYFQALEYFSWNKAQ